jgi:hypothetical protein
MEEEDCWRVAADELSKNVRGINKEDALTILGDLYLELSGTLGEGVRNPVAYLVRSGYRKWLRQQGRIGRESQRDAELDESLEEEIQYEAWVSDEARQGEKTETLVSMFSNRCVGERFGGLEAAKKAAMDFCDRYHLRKEDYGQICSLGYAMAKKRPPPRTRYKPVVRQGAQLFATIYVARRRRR